MEDSRLLLVIIIAFFAIISNGYCYLENIHKRIFVTAIDKYFSHYDLRRKKIPENADGEIIMKTKVTIMLLLFIFLVFAPAFAGGWLIYHDGPYMGKVVDAETGEPIEGAAVVGIWFVGEYGHAEAPILKFFDAKETVTGENGEFVISSVTGFHLWPLAKLFNPQLKIFKPGYSNYDKNFVTERKTSLIKLKKIKTKKEKIDSIIGLDICGSQIDDTCIPINKIKNINIIIENEIKNIETIN